MALPKTLVERMRALLEDPGAGEGDSGATLATGDDSATRCAGCGAPAKAGGPCSTPGCLNFALAGTAPAKSLAAFGAVPKWGVGAKLRLKPKR